MAWYCANNENIVKKENIVYYGKNRIWKVFNRDAQLVTDETDLAFWKIIIVL